MRNCRKYLGGYFGGKWNQSYSIKFWVSFGSFSHPMECGQKYRALHYDKWGAPDATVACRATVASGTTGASSAMAPHSIETALHFTFIIIRSQTMKTEEFVLPDPMEIPIESIAPVITRLSSLQTALAARLIRIPTNLNQNESLPEGEDELLTTADAAKLLNVSEDWIYRRADRLPFARRLSRKALRFSRVGLMKWRKTKLG
jgi:hypothetical protein